MDQMLFDSVHAIYPDPADFPETFQLLELTQKEQWEEASKKLDEIIRNDTLHFLGWFQIADFTMFNKMKANPGIRRVFAKHGIRINDIPKSHGPEI
jgi:hypothetical protein